MIRINNEGAAFWIKRMGEQCQAYHDDINHIIYLINDKGEIPDFIHQDNGDSLSKDEIITLQKISSDFATIAKDIRRCTW